MELKLKLDIRKHYTQHLYILLLSFSQLTKILTDFLFAKLVAETRNEIIHKYVGTNKKKNLMKTLKEVVQGCQLSFSEITKNYKTDYDQISDREKDWLNNVEEKTFRLSENVRDDIEYVITKLKEDGYKFKESDTDKLSLFISQINGIIRIFTYTQNQLDRNYILDSLFFKNNK